MIAFTLLLALFIPRWSLLIGYLFGGILPNPTPLFLDFILTFFIPRLLIISYIVYNWHTLPSSGIWLTLHVIALLISFFLGGNDD